MFASTFINQSLIRSYLLINLWNNVLSSSLSHPHLSFTLQLRHLSATVRLLCLCVSSLARVRLCVVVHVSAEWMEPSCRSCQSLCQEMRSGCSEDTQHLSGTVQIRAPQAGVWVCVGVYLSGGVCVCVDEEVLGLKVCVIAEEYWWVCSCECIYQINQGPSISRFHKI